MGTLTLTDASANAVVDTLAARVNGGTVLIYTSGRTTLLATLTLSATAFATAASRSATINTVTGDAAADATGTAAEAVFRNSGATEEFSGSVTTTGGGGVIEFATVTWNINDVIDVTGGTLSYPA